MKNLRIPILISFLTVLFLVNATAQEVSTLRAELTDDHKINLTWDGSSGYNIERKTSKTGIWEPIGIGNDGSFIDTNTEKGEIYYYRFIRTNNIVWEIKSGFELPRVDYRGRLMLVVEESLTSTLEDKINQWILNAEGDGWTVLQQNVAKSTSVVEIKNMIRQEYISQQGLQSIFIFGDVAVPYSGSNAHDGHSNHSGAWPTDVFFGEMDELWTDHIVNKTENLAPRTQNIPGDGKYDNNKIYSAEIELGRVDLANMPIFPKSELELLEQYLDKNNDFKTRKIIPKIQAFSLDNILAGTGRRASKHFPNLVGAENFKTGSFRDELTSDSYLIANGAGFASYTSVGGISNSQNMVTDSLQVIFTTAFGSYFGDWDNDNNYLRALLCSGTVLTSNWDATNFNNMALGNTIGYDLKEQHSTVDAVKVISLLGDPTLRMQMGNQVDEISLARQDENVEISWQYNSTDIDRIIRFNIYRRSKSDTRFMLIAEVPTSSNSYIDTDLTESGDTRYMIRAEYLETSPIGSYFNQGIGIHMQIDVPFVDLDNDGYDSYEDCNDQAASINPGIIEIANNFVDDNCNGIIDEIDMDQDGYFDFEDCNDEDANINFSAEEIINNGIDENCDGIDDLANDCYAYNDIPQKLFFGAIDFYHGVTICDDLDGLPIEQEIKPDDSFAFDGEHGRSYTFSFCEGYDEAIWKAVILVFPYNYKTGDVGPLLDYVEDCEYTFTIDSTSLTPDYIIVVKNKITCHLDVVDLTPNGFLNFSCAYIDQDQDGFFDYQECDDSNANVNPDQLEIPFNLLDDDCNPNTFDNDGDQDGYPVTIDCDDNDPNINPGALEIPNNMIDDNCNGLIDEIDEDGDGVSAEEDCDDTNFDINPNAYDYPNNGIDEDCDGIESEVDSCLLYYWGPYEDFAGVTDFCTDEPLSSGYQAGALNSYMIRNLTPEIQYIFSFCEDFNFDSWTPVITVAQYDTETETTGYIIHGTIDCEISFKFPYDPEFPDIIVIVGNSEICMGTTAPNSLTDYTFSCAQIDEDNDGFYSYEDCDDQNPNINPNAVEICDNIDNDCDGYIDEDPTLFTYYLDQDDDGFGDDNQTIESCQAPENYAAENGDCDDTNPNVNPNQSEIPYNGLDDDCNPLTLDDDLDQDGFVIADDCDDDNADINPDKQEIAYNGIDDDCNPLTLDDDLDQDGFVIADDCDDDNADINPDKQEIAYNGIDDDCNPLTLDDDLDQDGFVLADDCDDDNADINPDAEEIPNNDVDEDCDGNDLMTAVNELAGVPINIFPNPAFDVVTIDFESDIDYGLFVYNLLGELILSQENKEIIQVGNLMQGTYLLVVKDLVSGDRITRKMVVARK